MKISYNWLKWYIPEAPTAEKLHDVITYHLTEVEGMEKLADGDTILDINILPNRAHDLLSHSGVARELSGQLGLAFTDPTKTYTDIMAKKPQYQSKLGTGQGNLQVDIRNLNCRRYSARIVKNIKVGPSPEWVVKHLESVGQRSINNIVDATNLVMFNCGQPVHAFDARKFEDKKVVITNASEGSELELVGKDKIVAKLKDTDLVIGNSAGVILALGGVKGGTNSGVADDTTDLILEVANFAPTSIRKTARRIGVLSDSAKRFENDLSPELCTFGMLELSALISEMCPDAVFEEIVDMYPVVDFGEAQSASDEITSPKFTSRVYPNKQEERKISFTTEFVNKKVGGNITNDEVEQILKNYKFTYENNNGNFIVVVPSLRLDLENPIDMAEEIGRIYGYDKLVPVLPQISFQAKQNDTYQKILVVRNHLINEGYREVMTYAFGKKGEVEVMASASDKNFLRTNLTDGLKASFEMNRLNAPLLGIDAVKIFEIGNVFKKDKEEIHVACADKKGVTEFSLDEFLTKFGIDSKKSSDLLSGDLVISSTEATVFDPIPNFVLWSVYPFITRDLSLWVSNDNDKDVVLEIIKNEGGSLLVKDPQILDRFEKEGKISFAFRMVFQSYERTLSDEEVSKIMDQINQKVMEKGYIPR
ncbi:MAG: phenylalanyl-tRNA synthetase beta chain [Patescibacteria group bacterium]|nr:phenylalanyl-tRNA synthetase beta chain [Patescibacteria group bacterium]